MGEGAGGGRGSRERLLLAVVLLVLLVARVGWAAFGPIAPVVSDASGYDAAARRLLRTGSFAFPLGEAVWDGEVVDEAAWQTYLRQPPNAFSMPGYPAFVAAAYALGGDGPGRAGTVLILQALVSCVGLLLLFLLVRRLVGPPAAWAALALAAVYPPNLWAPGYLLTETLFTTLLLAVVYACVLAATSRRLVHHVLAGVLTAAAVHVRPTALLLPLLLVAWEAVALFRTPRKERPAEARRVGVGLASLAAVVALLLAPWVARNARVYHAFVPLTSASAIGRANGVFMAYRGTIPRELIAQRMPPEAAANDHGYAVSVDRMVRELESQVPFGTKLRVLAGSKAKWLDALSSPFEFYSRLFLLPHPLALMQLALLGLALAGAWSLRRDPLALLFLLGVPVYDMLVLILTGSPPMSRYLYPAMQLLIALAAAGVARLVALARPGGGASAEERAAA